MKKQFKTCVCLLAGALLFAACSDDDEKNVREEVTVADGVFILNEGSYFSKIDGSLDYLDYSTGTVSRNVFKNKNGRSLGGTPNNAVVCGSKMYITTADENRVEVVDARSMKAYSPINIVTPREVCTDGAAVYVTSYDGTVSKIDTTALKVVAQSAAIGDALEGITTMGGYLYVCNAWKNLGGYSYEYHTNVVKLQASDLSKVKDITVAANPNQILNDGTNIYLACWGNYADVQATVQRIDANDQVTTLTNGRMIALDKANDFLYIINTTYDENWAEKNNYNVYDLKTGKERNFTQGAEVFSPAAIGVDPTTGDVFITSYNESEDYKGSASYTTDGFVVRYSTTGTFLNKYTCGVGPGTLVFAHHKELK